MLGVGCKGRTCVRVLYGRACVGVHVPMQCLIFTTFFLGSEN